MNNKRQPLKAQGKINGPERRFHLTLKKPRDRERPRESCKENDSPTANRNMDIYNYRNIGVCESDNSSTDSQNYKLRLSESLSLSKKGSRRVESGKSNTTVSLSDSTNSGSSNENSPRRYLKAAESRAKKFSRFYPTPFYRSKDKGLGEPLDTIVIESSDSEEDSIFNSKEECGGIIKLDSDDDSVLKALKVDSSKRKDENSRFRDAEFFNSAESFKRDQSGEAKRSGKIDAAGNYGSDNSSSRSSSTNFSPDLNRSSTHKVISESSSTEDVNTQNLMNEEGMFSLRLTERRKSKSYDKRSEGNSSLKDVTSEGNKFANISKSNSKLVAQFKPYDSLKLTKKDAERLLKGVKVPGNSHWTPRLGLPYSQHESDSISSHSQGVKGRLKAGKVINETASDLLISDSSSEDIISNSSSDLKPAKTHVSRFMNPPNQEQQYTNLSDRKKMDISHWLMNNTPGSSSSSSIISESNRNSSFGNSSLERFELKHETPNNRGKISKPNTCEKSNSAGKPMDRFVYKGKTSVVKNRVDSAICDSLERIKPRANEVTPLNQATKARREIPDDTKKKNNTPAVKAVENLHMEDCADILDKLYGNVWRNKADAVFTPPTEPRPEKHLIYKKQQSNTERKLTSKQVDGNRQVLSGSEVDEFDAWTKDIRPNFNSTKKKPPRDSFINDKSTSENSSESFYHTALTNPRESKDNQQPKPTPVSVTTVRAAAICDSESDLEENYPRLLDNDLNRKRLSFSEDSSDTSTSEFDPGEIVLPKPKARKAPTTAVRRTSKATNSLVSSKLSTCDKKSKSFLASLSATVPIHSCHPKARIYRDNYKTKKEELCRYLFELYNKEIFDGKLPNDMAIEWNVRMRGTAGFCYNRKSIKALGGVVRSSRIVLATKILDTPDRLRDTLVHEMCHAAAWLINNVSDGHGPFWKGWASKAIKTFPELPPIKRCHDYKIKTKFTYRCTKCGYSIGRHSKSLDIESKRCGHCYGKFELLINRTTRSGTTQVSTPVQSRTPNGFALYVKENYHSVKKDRRSIKHAEVMKILGQQFSAIKIAKKPINNIST